jgi:nucleotidyltransferase substrate binding protein (TIGR01987 family)
MELNLDNLKKAVLSLEESAKIADTILEKETSEAQKNFCHAAVIQNFEFTYELCWKFMKRGLKEYFNINEELNKTDLFREASANKLIDDDTVWQTYYKARNITSHTYDTVKANEIFQIAKQFLKDAKFLLNNLERLNGK